MMLKPITTMLFSGLIAMVVAACGATRCAELDKVSEEWSLELIGFQVASVGEKTIPSSIEVASEYDPHASADAVCRWQRLNRRVQLTDSSQVSKFLEAAKTDASKPARPTTCVAEDLVHHVLARAINHSEVAYWGFRFCRTPGNVESGLLYIAVDGNLSSIDAPATAMVLRQWLVSEAK